MRISLIQMNSRANRLEENVGRACAFVARAAGDKAELVVLPDFTGGPEQLWRFDQLADGSWRIMPKTIPNARDSLALSAVGSSFATLAKFDPKVEKQRWWLNAP